MPIRLKSYKNKEKARTVRNEQRARNYAQTREGAFSSKQSWSTREIALIMTSELTDREISKEIGRSVQAIQAKRYTILKKQSKTSKAT